MDDEEYARLYNIITDNSLTLSPTRVTDSSPIFDVSYEIPETDYYLDSSENLKLGAVTKLSKYFKTVIAAEAFLDIYNKLVVNHFDKKGFLKKRYKLSIDITIRNFLYNCIRKSFKVPIKNKNDEIMYDLVSETLEENIKEYTNCENCGSTNLKLEGDTAVCMSCGIVKELNPKGTSYVQANRLVYTNALKTQDKEGIEGSKERLINKLKLYFESHLNENEANIINSVRVSSKETLDDIKQDTLEKIIRSNPYMYMNITELISLMEFFKYKNKQKLDSIVQEYTDMYNSHILENTLDELNWDTECIVKMFRLRIKLKNCKNLPIEWKFKDVFTTPQLAAIVYTLTNTNQKKVAMYFKTNIKILSSLASILKNDIHIKRCLK